MCNISFLFILFSNLLLYLCSWEVWPQYPLGQVEESIIFCLKTISFVATNTAGKMSLKNILWCRVYECWNVSFHNKTIYMFDTSKMLKQRNKTKLLVLHSSLWSQTYFKDVSSWFSHKNMSKIDWNQRMNVIK